MPIGKSQGARPAAISVEVSIDCTAWTEVCPNAAALAEAAARAVLAPIAVKKLTLAVILTDDREQQRLNLTYRGKDAATNVLAFPLADPQAPVPPGAPVILGDVVLAFETVAREAADQQKSLADHLRHLVVHGTLHLLGF